MLDMYIGVFHDEKPDKACFIKTIRCVKFWPKVRFWSYEETQNSAYFQILSNECNMHVGYVNRGF